MSKISTEQLLSDLDPAQRLAASTVVGPVQILAGAGTGKTRTITRRLAYAVATGATELNRSLSLTFTTRAAGEMRSRLAALGLPGAPVRTFHAAALSQLSYFWPQAIGGNLPGLVSSKAPLLIKTIAAAELNLPTNNQLLKTLAGEIEWAKSCLISPENYVVGGARRELRGIPVTPELSALAMVARVYEAYEQFKREERVIDFEDVLLLTAGMLASDLGVRSQVQSQYRYFTIDEYQDVSPLQQLLLEQWVGNRRDIAVVGDPAQTIYSFAGASSAYLLNFPNQFPDAICIDLTSSYRSTPQIIDFARKIIGGELRSAQSSNLASQDERPSDGLSVQQAQQVLERRFNSEQLEFDYLVEALSGGAADCAVLARTNSQLEQLQLVLTKAGIKSYIKGNERFFERPDVVDFLRALRTASVLPEPDWRQSANSLAASFGNSDAVTALCNLMSDEFASMRAFLVHIDERIASQSPPDLPGVTLSTIHAAKGAEWDQIYLIGASNGLLPLSTAKSASEVEEERRLLYVAVTRAKRGLIITGAGERSFLLPN
jgi:DNA helicase-2/ATP-dependent DNA helicase PcrA